MAAGTLAAFLRQLTRGVAGAEPGDRELLDRFARRGDGDAFALLVRRHGPMVHGVCLRVLGRAADAEDAFQGTFFLLARKAGRLRRPELVAAWLHGVARRVALKARAKAARRRERPAGDVPAPASADETAWRDLRPALDSAVGRLPAKYRVPFVLCYLEGLTHAQAARRLGCAPGTVATWLARARARLRDGLTRQGLAPSAALLAAGLAREAAAAVPPRLPAATARAAAALAAARPGAGGVPATFPANVWRVLAMNPRKSFAAALLLAALAGSAALLAHRPAAAGPAAGQDKTPPAPPAPAAPAAGPAALAGKVVDARGKPLVDAEVVGMYRRGPANTPNGSVRSDADGRFALDRLPEGPPAPGKVVTLRVTTKAGPSFEVNVVAPRGKDAEVRVPTVLDPAAKAPDKVAPDELAGVVVDEAGKPLEGVHVHVWDWVPAPENQTTTGKDGVFRIKDVGRDWKVQVRFRKPGYSPEMFVNQPAGVPGLVVALGKATAFEGVVHGPDGRPAPGAVVRANQGPKFNTGVVIGTVWTETTADDDGHFRLPVQPDEYEFEVKAKGVGVARVPGQAVGRGETRQLAFVLDKGVTFRATVLDAGTNRPVPGVRLWHWQHKNAEGRSDDKGEIAVGEMLPGQFEFQVEAKGYARWWSEEAAKQWQRKPVGKEALRWQRNFDDLTFDLKPGIRATIFVEKGVRVTGRVVDPDGKPVAGATVAPAHTGTGNSLTGDTRFSVETDKGGRFEALLPAGNGTSYNLVAHDGKFGEWRKWANGVLDPVLTFPGQELKDVTLTLTRPATVRGRVVDKRGKPVAHREVRAHAADKRENRYYDPTATTKEDGTFELRFVRPGEQFVQVAPFWMRAEEAPEKSSRRLKLKADQTVKDVELTAEDLPK
jgi:RNA polymerase sigma factor (sigma-70 family)